MRRRVLGILAATAMAATVTIAGGSTAVAHPTWTVGPLTSGTFNFTGTAGTTLLTDTGTGTQLTCSSSTASGNGTYGSGQSGTPIARITNSTWNNCTGPSGITFTVTHAGTWNLNAISHTTGGASGTITNIAARLSGPFCSATVSGSVNAVFTNSTATSRATLQVLTAGSGLRISNVSGCFGLIRSGDTATFDGTYTINPPWDLTITD